MIIQGFDIDLQRKRIKNLHLRIRSDGTIYLSAPLRTSMDTIESFVSDNREWIVRGLEKRRASNDDTSVPVLGERKEVIVTIGGKDGFTISDDGIHLTLTEDSPEARKKVIDMMYRSIIENICPPMLDKWSFITGLEYEEWRIRTMTTRWGTCNTRARRIWLNSRLAMAPVECIEYVVLHEILHIRYPNHGEGFKVSLTKYMPDWKERKKILNQYNIR